MYAPRVKSAIMSEIRVMMTAAPPNAINLGLGEPDFQPPKHVIAALQKAVANGYNKYGSTMGLKELRLGLVDNLKSKKPDIALDNVMITVGASGALMVTMQAFINDGDEVLIPNPGFVLYKPQVDLHGGIPVPYSLREKNNFQPDIEELRELITPRTKAMIVNTPSNPTGGVVGEKEIDAIADLAREHNLVVISDEVYDEIIYNDRHHSFLGKCDNHVYINSFSKTYAMTGWRVGYAVADSEIIKQLEKIQYCNIACPPTPFQYALIEALEGPQDFVAKIVKEFRTRRDFFVRELNSIDGFRCLEPKGSFYVFPSFKFKMTSKDLAMKLLEGGVICAPGSAFGSEGEGHLRFSYANSVENLEKGLEIVRSVVKDL
jgi:aspartate aminotransferase